MPMTAQKLRRVIFVSRQDLSDTSCPPCLHNRSLFRAGGKIKRSERRETTTSLLFLGHQKYRNESVFYPERRMQPTSAAADSKRPAPRPSHPLFIWPFILLLAYLWAPNRWSCQGGGGGGQRWTTGSEQRWIRQRMEKVRGERGVKFFTFKQEMIAFRFLWQKNDRESKMFNESCAWHI